jgi:hypothetical protein
MNSYTWIVESVTAGQMVVQYTHNETTLSLNLPVPPADAELSAWIDMYAPRAEWARVDALSVTPGMSGTGALAATMPTSEVPRVSGSWNEEYLRALIYTIMEEIQDQTV